MVLAFPHAWLMKTRASKSAAEGGGMDNGFVVCFGFLEYGEGLSFSLNLLEGSYIRLYKKCFQSVPKVFPNCYQSDPKVFQKCYQSVISLSGQLLY
jgi:hypothetical protein